MCLPLPDLKPNSLLASRRKDAALKRRYVQMFLDTAHTSCTKEKIQAIKALRFNHPHVFPSAVVRRCQPSGRDEDPPPPPAPPPVVAKVVAAALGGLALASSDELGNDIIVRYDGAFETDEGGE